MVVSGDAATPDELVEPGDLPELLGVGRGRAYVLSREKRFPDPWFVGRNTRLWRRSDIERYVATYRPAESGPGQ